MYNKKAFFQAVTYMWTSLICKLPEILGRIVLSFVTYIGLVVVGLYSVQAVIRVLMVVQVQGVPHQIGSLLALNYDFRYYSESLSKMNHFKKSYKAIVKYFLQKLLGFSSIMCVF